MILTFTNTYMKIEPSYAAAQLYIMVRTTGAGIKVNFNYQFLLSKFQFKTKTVNEENEKIQ